MKITKIETFILHVPVTGEKIEDSIHQVSHWGVPGLIISTDAGLCGYGYTGTHGNLPTDQLITDCISETYAPLLIGEDPHDVQWLWKKLFRFPPVQWVGRKGITHLALSAVDIALWDLKAKAAGLPLWKLLGGSEKKELEAYNTDAGWLNRPIERIVDEVKELTEQVGFRGVKIKVGSTDPYRDLDRIAAVRKAVGNRTKLMVDANGRWNLPTAMNIGQRFRDFDIYWFEEPLWYDDIPGHAALAQTLSTPIALGEQLYSVDDFRNFIHAGAVHFAQADALRLGGITEWWQVADLALAYRLPVAPHIGDMMQVHLHLCLAHDACTVLEYIPWIRGCFEEPATVKNGMFLIPQAPGAGTTLRPQALQQYNVLC